MARIVRKANIEGVPRDVLMRVVEVVCDGLVEDARQNFGRSFNFKTDTRVNEERGTIEAYLQFLTFKYDFLWQVSPKGKAFEVTLDARTPGSWYEFIYDVPSKLSRLTDVQWSALVNFTAGFVTGEGYARFRGKYPKEKIKKAREARHAGGKAAGTA